MLDIQAVVRLSDAHRERIGELSSRPKALRRTGLGVFWRALFWTDRRRWRICLTRLGHDHRGPSRLQEEHAVTS